MAGLHKVSLVALLLCISNTCHGFRIHPGLAKRFKSMRHIEENAEQDEQKLFFKSHIPDPVTKARVGQGLVLDCEAGGSPTPTIHWLFKGNRIPQGGATVMDDEVSYENTPNNAHMQTLKLGSTKSKLFIDCISPAEVGQYTCVADTPYRRISTDTMVSIESGLSESILDSCLMKRLEAGQPARIYMWTSQRLEFEGADVQLFCRRGGDPTPSIMWYDRNGHAIGESANQYTILGNGDLLIKSVNWENNMGQYKCVVENSKGRDEVKTFLYPVSEGQF